MLWYKAWLETRARFAISLGGMLLLSAYSVLHGDRQALSYVKADYYYSVLHGTHGLLSVMWILAVTLLMMGGLLREKALGTAPFTLALPVSRKRLAISRIVFGLVQSLLLAVVPWTGMYVVAITTGEARSGFQALFHLALLTGGGVVFFGLAVLVSSIVEGEYTAPAASLGIVLVSVVSLNSPSLRMFSPWAFMVGEDYFNREQCLLIGPVPWINIGIYLMLSLVLISISVKAIIERDF